MSLYSQYRPQKFTDLIGQDHVVVTLSRAIEQGKLSHSYLFSGPRGVGKTTVARILAKSANCQAKKDQPCGECNSCKTIAEGKSSDILEIDAASNRGIDEIRELRDKVRFAPSFGRYKVYIIDEVHMLTKEAFNALLKTLEEPPAHAIFILATTEAHKVPATIVSRCQRFDFRRATLKSVMELIERTAKAEKIDIEPEAIALIARAADGAYRDALTLLEQMAGEDTKITQETVRQKLGLIAEPLMWQLLSQIAAGQKTQALETFDKFVNQGVDWRFLTSGLLQKLRQLLFYILAPSVVTDDLTQQESQMLGKMAKEVDEAKAVAMINLFLRAQAQLRQTSMPEIPLATAIVEYFEQYGPQGPTPSAPAEDKKPVEPAKEQKVSVSQSEEANKNEPLPVEQKDEKANEEPSGELLPVAQGKWRQITAEVKKNNSTLAGLLVQSHPYTQGKELIIEVPYKFWEDRIKSAKNNKAICDAACVVLGETVECAIPKSNGDLKKTISDSHNKESAKVKEDIADVFG